MDHNSCDESAVLLPNAVPIHPVMMLYETDSLWRQDSFAASLPLVHSKRLPKEMEKKVRNSAD